MLRLGLALAGGLAANSGQLIAQRRQQLPWVRLDKEYRFETDEGSGSLANPSARSAAKTGTSSAVFIPGSKSSSRAS